MANLGRTHERPNARTHLTLARVAALATSFAAAFAVGLGISAEAFASGGAYIMLPFVAAAVVAILLGAGWHWRSATPRIRVKCMKERSALGSASFCF